MNYGNRALRNLYFSLPYPLKSVLSSTYGLVQRNRRQGKAFSDCLAFLDRSQWLSNDELARLQLEQVRKFLAFCCHHSRFYADLFRKIGFDPSGLRAIEDLRRLPLLTKEVLRDNVGAIVPDTLKRLRPIWTHTSRIARVFPKGICFPCPELLLGRHRFGGTLGLLCWSSRCVT